MAKHVLSIEIGQQITKVVEIDYRKKNPHVYRAVSFATPADVIDDGFIRDRDALAVAFREQLSQAGMREKSVVFSIASSKIATREITLPDVKENKVGALVMATAQDYFPVDLANYSVAYSIIDSVKDENGKSLKVLLLAAPDSLVDNYYNFADTMGFNIESLDYFGNGSMQVLKNEIVGSYSACIQISGNSSTVSVMNEGQQLMQRSVNYGVFSIGDAIAQSPDNPINTLDAACDALTRETMLCRTLDYEGLEASATGSDFASALELQAARRVATDACGDLIMSIVRVLDFFRSQNPGTQLTGLYITGMGVNVKGIDDLFASEISVPIHKMEHLVSVTFPKKFADSLYNPTEYIAVIGAAIAPVGFKSSTKGTDKVSTINMTPFYAVLGVAVVAGIALSAVSIIRYSNENKRNEELKTTKDSLSYVEAIYDQNTDMTTVSDSINTMDNATKNMNVYLNDLLKELETDIPTEMTVENLSITETNVNISMTSKTDVAIAKLLMSLEEISGLTNVQCTGITNAEAEGGEAEEGKGNWTFTVSADYVTVDEYDEVVESSGGELAMGKKKATSGSAVSTEDSDEESDDTTEATE